MTTMPLPSRAGQLPETAETDAEPSELGFDDFFRRERRAVLGLAYALTGSWPAAEDLTQEAFAAAHRRWRRVARYERPGAFVRRVVANRAVSRLRRLRTERHALARLERRPSRAEELEHRDHGVWEAVRSLPRRQAQVIALHYLEDRSVDEIAEIVGCGPGSVKTHLSRARRALARRLAPEEDPR